MKERVWNAVGLVVIVFILVLVTRAFPEVTKEVPDAIYALVCGIVVGAFDLMITFCVEIFTGKADEDFYPGDKSRDRKRDSGMQHDREPRGPRW